MNVDKSTFPIQKLPLSKKNKEWREASVDAIIAREGYGGFADSSSRRGVMEIAYNLYNSVYDENDLKYVTNPFKVEDGFPAKTQNFNIIRPKIDLLIGEESKRPFNVKVLQTNDEAVGKLQEQKKSLLLDYIMQQIGVSQDEEGNQITPPEIEKYLRYNYKSIAEETAFHSLNYLKEKLNLPNEFLKGWKDGLIAGEELYYIGIINGEPHLERVNPLNCSYDKDPDLEFIEDGDWFLRSMQMSPSTIYDRFFDLMDESDLDKLLEYGGEQISRKGGDYINTPSIMYREKMSSSFLRDQGEGINLLPVWHAVWRSYKKIGFLTVENENGEMITELVDEIYKPLEGDQIKWDWVPEVWEGYRVGEDLYFGIGPVEYQWTSVDNPSSRKLPYCGIIYSNTNARSKSLVSVMKPLQYMYIIIWYRLELTLARDKGKVINMDITQIPKGLGVDINQWMHYLSALGVNFINPYDEGWDIPGREGGKPSGFNQISDMDLSQGQSIEGYIRLMAKIEEMIGEICGVSKQRQGSIEQRELVGNVERSVIQSSHITEPLFWTHNQAKKNALNMLLNVAKHAWSETDAKKIHYILNDVGRVFLDITEDFLYSDYDIFFSDSSLESRDIEMLRSLLQPAMQGGATLLDAAEIVTGENMSQIKRKLSEIEERREQMMAQQSQMEQQSAEMELQMKLEQLRIQEEDSIRDAETQIKVALIRAESQGDVVDEDYTEEVKLELQREKQKRDEEIARKKLAEDIRKNKASEDLKRKELDLKRKQINKPVKTK